jgi:hypothetical protein
MIQRRIPLNRPIRKLSTGEFSLLYKKCPRTPRLYAINIRIAVRRITIHAPFSFFKLPA